MSKNLLIGLVSVCSLAGGIIAGIAGFARFENYVYTLLPFIVFSVIGLLAGVFVWRMLQKSLEKTVPAELRKGTSAFGTVVGFIGFGLYFGALINAGVSTESTHHCEIIQKSNTRVGARNTAKYFVHVKIDSKPAGIQCGHDYWNTLSVGDTVQVTYYNSPFGFDFLELPEDD